MGPREFIIFLLTALFERGASKLRTGVAAVSSVT
jgi:hypothetical protein